MECLRDIHFSSCNNYMLITSPQGQLNSVEFGATEPSPGQRWRARDDLVSGYSRRLILCLGENTGRDALLEGI
jgi:hypothetical protein